MPPFSSASLSHPPHFSSTPSYPFLFVSVQTADSINHPGWRSPASIQPIQCPSTKDSCGNTGPRAEAGEERVCLLLIPVRLISPFPSCPTIIRGSGMDGMVKCPECHLSGLRPTIPAKHHRTTTPFPITTLLSSFLTLAWQSSRPRPYLAITWMLLTTFFL